MTPAEIEIILINELKQFVGRKVGDPNLKPEIIAALSGKVWDLIVEGELELEFDKEMDSHIERLTEEFVQPPIPIGCWPRGWRWTKEGGWTYDD